MSLNKEELLVGFIYGLPFYFLVGWWVILIAPITSLLWALGGRYGHAIRVFGVPLASYGNVLIVTNNLISIVNCGLTMLILSIGYGIPQINQYGIMIDEGSWLGRFWWNKTKSNVVLANVLTRLTIYTLLLLAFLMLIIWTV